MVVPGWLWYTFVDAMRRLVSWGGGRTVFMGLYIQSFVVVYDEVNLRHAQTPNFSITAPAGIGPFAHTTQSTNMTIRG